MIFAYGDFEITVRLLEHKFKLTRASSFELLKKVHLFADAWAENFPCSSMNTSCSGMLFEISLDPHCFDIARAYFLAFSSIWLIPCSGKTFLKLEQLHQSHCCSSILPKVARASLHNSVEKTWHSLMLKWVVSNSYSMLVMVLIIISYWPKHRSI